MPLASMWWERSKMNNCEMHLKYQNRSHRKFAGDRIMACLQIDVKKATCTHTHKIWFEESWQCAAAIPHKCKTNYKAAQKWDEEKSSESERIRRSEAQRCNHEPSPNHTHTHTQPKIIPNCSKNIFLYVLYSKQIRMYFSCKI